MLRNVKKKLWRESPVLYRMLPKDGQFRQITLGMNGIGYDARYTSGSVYANSDTALATDGDVLVLAKMIVDGRISSQEAECYCREWIFARIRYSTDKEIDRNISLAELGRHMELACLKEHISRVCDFRQFYFMDGVYEAQIVSDNLVYIPKLKRGYVFDTVNYAGIVGVKFSPFGRLMALEVSDFSPDVLFEEADNIRSRLVDLDTGDSQTLWGGGCIGMYKGSLGSVKKQIMLG